LITVSGISEAECKSRLRRRHKKTIKKELKINQKYNISENNVQHLIVLALAQRAAEALMLRYPYLMLNLAWVEPERLSPELSKFMNLSEKYHL